MLHVMKEYGWDFYTYKNQPAWVIELAMRKLDIEGKLAKMAQEQNNA